MFMCFVVKQFSVYIFIVANLYVPFLDFGVQKKQKNMYFVCDERFSDPH